MVGFVVVAASVMMVAMVSADVISNQSYFPADGPAELMPWVVCDLSTAMYTLNVGFTYTDKLTQCPNTGIVPPSQSYVLNIDSDCTKATGFKTVMINWNPCGHAPVDFWGIGHFDVHVYRVSDPNHMFTCGPFPENPVCLPPNPLAAPFFEPLTHDRVILNGSVVEMDAAGIANMGMHWYNFPTVPADEWIIPAVIEGSYSGEVIFVEQMFPLLTMKSSVDIEQTISYANQTMYYLPTQWAVATDAWDRTATASWTGYKICNATSKGMCKKNPNCKVKKNKCVPK